MKPHISVVAATRGRTRLLNHLLNSLWATAAEPDGVEVVFRVDFDDKETIEFLSQRGRSSFIVGPRLQGYATLGALVNEAARLSRADLVIVVNDDAEFKTHGWDMRLLAEAARFPDGIFDLGVTSVLNNDNFVWPCTSRRVIDLIGIHDERVIYSDVWLRDVMAFYGRAIRVPDVIIEHKWIGLSVDQQRAIGSFDQAVHAAAYVEARAKIGAALGREQHVA